jgi:hypothetical protein
MSFGEMQRTFLGVVKDTRSLTIDGDGGGGEGATDTAVEVPIRG